MKRPDTSPPPPNPRFKICRSSLFPSSSSLLPPITPNPIITPPFPISKSLTALPVASRTTSTFPPLASTALLLFLRASIFSRTERGMNRFHMYSLNVRVVPNTMKANKSAVGAGANSAKSPRARSTLRSGCGGTLARLLMAAARSWKLMTVTWKRLDASMSAYK